MHFGFVVSLALHVAVLAWAFVTLHATSELRSEEVTPISVEIITPSELTRLKQGDPQSKHLEAKAKEEPKPEKSQKEAPKPKPITAPPPPPEPPPPPPAEEAKKEEPLPPPPKAEPPKSDPIAEKLAALQPEPEPGPNPEELKRLEEEKRAEEQRKADEAKRAEEQRQAEERRKEEEKKAEERKKEEERKKAEEKRKAEEKKKAEERKKALERQKLAEQKKKQFDADRIAALIDKTPDKRGAPNSALPPTNPTTYTGPTAGEREGRDTVLSAREADLLKGAISAQLRSCWRLPGGGGGIETVIVTVRWRLKPDGSLDGEPHVEQPQSDPVFRIAAEAAVRAVKGCAPFTLPPDKYSAWKTIIWDFDPREML